MKAFTKSQRKEVKRLSDLAHQRELEGAMEDLEANFGRWRKGEIDVFHLNELIHQFHNGVSRDLYKFYGLSEAHHGVAFGLARGIIDESEVDPEIREKLGELIDFMGGS